MAKKSPPARLFVEVLQNGHTVCDYEIPLKRTANITLGTDPRATLTLPHYPLPARVDLMSVRNGIVRLESTKSWTGFVTSNGDIVELENHKVHDLELRRGDYGTVHYGDLEILIRLGKPKIQKEVKIKKAYPPGLGSLFFHDQQETKVAFGALFFALLILGPVVAWLATKKLDHPQSLAELKQDYIVSFMYPGHFETIPEAIQMNLNRKNYPLSTINYYTSMAHMLAGHEIPFPGLLFQSSIQYFQGLYREMNENIEKLEVLQRDFENSYLAKPEAALIDIPTVKGRSVREKIVSILDKIDLHHESLRDQLENRRDTRTKWKDLPSFNAQDYKSGKTAEQLANKEKLRKIAPFRMESNESNMYRAAEDWADKSEYRRKSIKLHSARKSSLVDPEFTHILVPENMNFASFLHRAAVLADEDKLAGIRASVYGRKPKVKIKEPLIGEIDPKLIRKTVEENWQSLRLCYELALRRDKKLAGEMEWSWRVDSRGDISEIELITSNISDNRMLTCIKNKMSAWKFPPPRRGSVQVRYPFRFSKTKG